MDFLNKRKNQRNNVIKERNGNLQNFENSRQSNESKTTEITYGWYKYGCAGEVKCLSVGVLSMSSRQPNGNQFCFSNFGSLEAAEIVCMMLNNKTSKSCSHIVSYQIDSGEYRWELLNLQAEAKCKKYFDQETIKITAFKNTNRQRFVIIIIRKSFVIDLWSF